MIPMKTFVKKALPILIATVVFVLCVRYVFRTFQWSEIVFILRNAELAWLLGAGSGAIVLFWLLRSLRWWVLLEALGVRIGFLELYYGTALSLTLSTVTPLQSGEILKIELLKKDGRMERSAGYGSFLLERALDVVAIVVITVAGAAYRLYLDLDQASFWIVIAGFMALAVLALRFFGKIPMRFATAEIWKQLSLQTYNVGTILVATVLTLCSWIAVAIGWQVCLLSISLSPGLEEILFMAAALSIINVLSFIPGGIGIFEAGAATFLLAFGEAEALAQTGAIILRFQLILVLALGALHYAVREVRTRKAARGRLGTPGRSD